MEPNVSVIIPTLNEQAAIPKLLASLSTQKYKGEIQVLIIDGGSTDKTIELVHKFRNKIKDLHVIESKRGLPYQRNLGASKAKYDHMLFIDADSVITPNFLSKLYRNKKAASVQPYVALPLIVPDHFNITDYAFTAIAYLFFISRRLTNPIVTGMCIATNCSNHNQVGGFDERAVYADDIQYGIESFKKGARYYIFWRAQMFSSARRARELGRIKLGMIWLLWYQSIIKNGAITDKSAYDYKFGHFK